MTPPSFTSLNLVAVAVALCTGSRHLRAVTTCTSLGVAFSFHSAILFDRTAFARIASRHGYRSMARFHVENALAHLAPCLLTHRPCRAVHGVVAAALHLGWGLVASRGTLRLDHVYVAMPPLVWAAMWSVAATTEVLAGALL